MKFLTLLLASALATLLSQSVWAQCTKTSPAHAVALLELYSSEGCSSCPPADELLRKLYPLTGLQADQVIPLALHVDYWDYLGWKDPYGKALHTKRQYALSKLAGSHTIYTPEFFMSGTEFRPGLADLRNTVLAINRQPAQAEIRIALNPLQGNRLTAQIQASAQQPGVLHAVLVEQGLSSQVHGGENGGSNLRHDAVAREWAADQPVNVNGAHSQTVQWVLPVNAVPENLSVVAFIENQQGKILQALSLPLCR